MSAFPLSPALARRRLLGLAAAGLAAPAFVRHARAAELPRFALGVASGQPLPDRLVLWTRLTGADLPAQVPVAWELAHDAGFARIAARGSVLAEAAWAHSVHAEPGDLEPGRGYFYRFTALGQASAVGRTRTAPAPDAPATLHAVLASCQRWDHGHWAAWRHAAAQSPDLVLFVGDYIYEYATPADAVVPRRHDGPRLRNLDAYRARYAQYKADPALQAAHAACPWLLVWDDHEVENDYADRRGSTLAGAELLRLRAAAYQAWWEHQPVPLAMRPVGPDARIHQRLTWGRLASLHLLDDRQYRDPQPCLPAGRVGGSSVVNAVDCAALHDPQRSLLGAAQERWLAEGWDLQRPWNLLVQQTLMARFSRSATPGGDGNADPPAGSARPAERDATGDTGRYWTDGWDGYPAARARLLGTVAQRQVPGVLVLGGDVHAHHVARLVTDFDDPRAPAVASEFCGSSISSHGPPQASLDAARAHNPHVLHSRGDQRGTVLLRIDARQARAELTAVDRPDDPASTVRSAARFVVDAARPGPESA